MRDFLILLACAGIFAFGLATSRGEAPAPARPPVVEASAFSRVNDDAMGEYVLTLGNVADRLVPSSRWCQLVISKSEGDTIEVVASRADVNFEVSEVSAAPGRMRFTLTRQVELGGEVASERWQVELAVPTRLPHGASLKGQAQVKQVFEVEELEEGETAPTRDYRFAALAVPTSLQDHAARLEDAAEERDAEGYTKERDARERYLAGKLPDEILRELPYAAVEEGKEFEALEHSISEGQIDHDKLPYEVQQILKKRKRERGKSPETTRGGKQDR